MSVRFLSPDGAGPAARSPILALLRGAGARVEVRDGWEVAVGVGDPEDERRAVHETVGWADVSHIGKLELQGPAPALDALAAAEVGSALAFGRATLSGSDWWCPMTPERTLVLCPAGALGALRERLEVTAGVDVVDLTSAHGATAIAGPLARECFARFCAIDLRPHVTPVHGFRPGSAARTPAAVLREAEERYLLLFGWALGEYVWQVVEDAGRHLGGAPVGVDALPEVAAAAGEPARA